MSFGLTALMEAVNKTEKCQAESDALLEATEDIIDDDVKAMVTGDDSYDDVDIDRMGLGTDEADEEKYKKLLDMIPEDDEDTEEDIDDLCESVLPVE